MLVVDPWHWLAEDGLPPDDDMRLRRRALRIARLIEYGGPLAALDSRETLVECSKRPGRRQCLGLMWVTKTKEDAIFAYCPICRGDEVMIHNWQETLWAEGMMEPVSLDDASSEPEPGRSSPRSDEASTKPALPVMSSNGASSGPTETAAGAATSASARRRTWTPSSARSTGTPPVSSGAESKLLGSYT